MKLVLLLLPNHLILSLVYCFIIVSSASKCPSSFPCGILSLNFPFTQSKKPECGLFTVDACDSHPIIHLQGGGISYNLLQVNVLDNHNTMLVRDHELQELLNHHSYCALRNVSLPKSPFVSLSLASPIFTFFSCIPISSNGIDCSRFSLFNETEEISDPSECSTIQVPITAKPNRGSHLLTGEFNLKWKVSEVCYECHRSGGQCLSNSINDIYCKRGRSRLVLILAISGGGLVFLVCLLISYIIWLLKKRVGVSYLRSTNISLGPSKSDIFFGNGIPIFSYTELEAATDNFNPSRELGNGGFGTVYYGKLVDGREVAIKRLYEQNCRRVEQFMNEINILTSLKHPNLVSLYGCTSRRSRELLLVYEYIPNGTVADHLHGERANAAPLTWPIRMRIAIETATALTFLHKSDIIHRDVKTDNILIDKYYVVKVADFGLSRLFPSDLTYISTAPGGTPGYIDPDYHHCYQVTDKSDVYSFGVVLIELISSMTAVDVSRKTGEINLANLAVTRIQRCAFHELIDPSLGYNLDPEVTRMTTSVAEVAFRCLQQDKEMRPPMAEVLAFLKDI